MAKIDVTEIKRKILGIIESEGPSLPIPIAKKIGMQPMFAAAILSELLNEKRVKTSFLRVGSSPLYLIPGQEEKLEKFTENLTGVEKEAYLKLRDNKILSDDSQEPKIRIALRSLKDFAIPVQINNKMHWKYVTVPNEKVRQATEDEGEVAIGEQRVVGQKIWEDIQKNKKETEQVMASLEHKETTPVAKIVETIAERVVEKEPPVEIPEKKIKVKKLTEKDLFLENAKRILAAKNIEILEVLQTDKKQIIAKARVQVDRTCILFFLDKKRPDEKDLAKAYKKAKEYELPYFIVTQAEAPKKIKDSKEMYRTLLGMDSVE